jgi:hypothetical protein
MSGAPMAMTMLCQFQVLSGIYVARALSEVSGTSEARCFGLVRVVDQRGRDWATASDTI